MAGETGLARPGLRFSCAAIFRHGVDAALVLDYLDFVLISFLKYRACAVASCIGSTSMMSLPSTTCVAPRFVPLVTNDELCLLEGRYLRALSKASAR
jgi:hypothetical protein